MGRTGGLAKMRDQEGAAWASAMAKPLIRNMGWYGQDSSMRDEKRKN